MGVDKLAGWSLIVSVIAVFTASACTALSERKSLDAVTILLGLSFVAVAIGACTSIYRDRIA